MFRMVLTLRYPPIWRAALWETVRLWISIMETTIPDSKRTQTRTVRMEQPKARLVRLQQQILPDFLI